MEENDLRFYRSFQVPSIDILAPGTFENVVDNGIRKTVFLACDSDELALWEYKPDYPDSFFHITLYDGFNESLAEGVLSLLTNSSWGFQLPLPKGTLIDEIEISSGRSRGASKRREVPSGLLSLYHELFGHHLSQAELEESSDEQVLNRIQVIISNLEDISKDFSVSLFTPESKSIVDPSGDFANWTTYQSPLPFGTDFDRVLRSSAPKSGGKEIHLTPPELALSITQYASGLLDQKQPINFGDPALGKGVFFLSVSATVGDRLESAIGVEVNAGRAAATGRRWEHKGLEVINGDFLSLRDLPPRNLVIANPPYLRFQGVKAISDVSWLERIQQSLQLKIPRTSSLYVYFLLLCHDWLEEGGISAWLLPSEFMENDYGSVVRRYLADHVELIRIHRFDRKKMQFEDALVSSAVVVFRKGRPSKEDVLLSYGHSLETPLEEFRVSVRELKDSKKWTLPWATPEQSDCLTVGDFFNVRRGIATGANDVFILDRARAELLGLPHQFLRPVLPKSRYLESDVVESAPDGFPLLDSQLVLLDCDLSPAEIQRSFPELNAYYSGVTESTRANHLLRSRKLWYKQEKRLPAPFLCTYMGRGSSKSSPLRFIRNKSLAVATNTYLLLYPKEHVNIAAKAEPDLYDRIFTTLKQIPPKDFVICGRSYGGELRKIEPRELERLPIRDCPQWMQEILSTDVGSTKNFS